MRIFVVDLDVKAVAECFGSIGCHVGEYGFGAGAKLGACVKGAWMCHYGWVLRQD